MDIVVQILDSLFTETDMSGVTVSIPLVFEFGAVLTGAISGALTACDKRLDLVGACVLALVTSLGGGLIRDMILSDQGVYMLQHPAAIACCFLVAVIAFFFSGLLHHFSHTIADFDMMSVAMFTIVGADKALVAGYTIIPCVLMGVLTGVGGGMARDIIMGKIPFIFRTGNFYAICSVIGAAAYCICVEAHVIKGFSAVVGVCVVLFVRYLSLHFRLQTTTAHDYSQRIFGRWISDLDANDDDDDD